jgi:hypothetical protein
MHDGSMTLNVSGGCLCGQYRYEISGTPIAMFNCHCRDCQQSTGGPYSPVVYVAKNSFRVIQGEMKHYSTDSEPGGSNKRGFCAECGARVTGGETDEGIGILASSLDDPTVFSPQVNIYVREAQPWDRIPDDIPAAQGSTA